MDGRVTFEKFDVDDDDGVCLGNSEAAAVNRSILAI